MSRKKGTLKQVSVGALAGFVIYLVYALTAWFFGRSGYGEIATIITVTFAIFTAGAIPQVRPEYAACERRVGQILGWTVVSAAAFATGIF